MNAIQNLRNSAAEILALVVEEMYPKITLLKGGATEQGFFYDFLAEQPLEPHVLVLIEEKMRAVIKQDLSIETLSMMRENAIELFRHRKQHAKAQQVATSSNPVINIIRIEKFFDYSNAPMTESTEPLRAFKLLAVEKVSHFSHSEGLVDAFRITGAVDRNPQELKKSLKLLDILKKNGFASVSSEMNLFSFQEDIGEIAWCWKPNGLFIKDLLINLWKEGLREAGYQIVATPPFVKKTLSRESRDTEIQGTSHLELSGDYEGAEYRLPISLTPSHISLFRNTPQQPSKYAECGLVSSGISDISLQRMIPPLTLADYAHSFTSIEKVGGELISSLQFIDKIIKMFGFGAYWQIIGRGKRFAGARESWEHLQEVMKQALNTCGLEAKENSLETAYTGPRLQCCLLDSLGREWLLPSISLDIGLPEKLGLRCSGNNGKMTTPVIVMTRLFGTLEKFIGVIVEHLQGELPLWLSPEQVRVIAVGPKQREYAEETAATLRKSGVRLQVDVGDEQLGKRIHEAERQRVPYVAVIGDQEVRGRKLSIRARGNGRSEMRSVTIQEFLNELLQSSQEFCKHPS